MQIVVLEETKLGRHTSPNQSRATQTIRIFFAVQRKVVGSIATSSLPFVGESDLFSDIPSPLFCFRIDTAPACRLQSPTTFARSTFFLFLIPPNTSHCLSPNDQWHQHINRTRISYTLRHSRQLVGEAATLDEELCALYFAIHFQSSQVKRVQAAFRHAGITRLERAVRHMKNQPSHVEPEDIAVTPPQSPASAPSGSSTPRSNTTPQPLVRVWDANWSLDEGRAHFDRLAASFSRLEERHQDMIRSTPRQRRLLDRITPQERSRRRRAPIFGPMSSGPSAADLEGRERRRVHLHASRERRATRVANEADLRAALNVQRITIANLKSFCRSHCLGTTGSRAELIARTRTQLELPQPPTTPLSPGRPAGEVIEPLATPLAQIESREDAELTPMPASPPRDDRNSLPSDSTPPTLTAASAAPSLVRTVEEEPQEPIARVGGHFADSDLQFWLRDYTSQTQPFQDATSPESNAPAAPLASSNTDQNEIDLLIKACDESTKKYKAYIDSLIALEPHTSTS